jgi:hypothetical protein
MIRIGCYIDGFNFYHAIDDMSRATRGRDNYLKWVDLPKLMQVFTDPAVHQIVHVKYFSAYAEWKVSQSARHRIYVSALKACQVEVILGRFKDKEMYCKKCQGNFWGHEEKESDVNLACHLTADVCLGVMDQAFVLTRDSDLAGPLRFVRQSYPNMKLKVIAPPGRSHSKELWALAHLRATVTTDHLKKCLLPQALLDGNGQQICTRPAEYDPPATASA